MASVDIGVQIIAPNTQMRVQKGVLCNTPGKGSREVTGYASSGAKSLKYLEVDVVRLSKHCTSYRCCHIVHTSNLSVFTSTSEGGR